MGMMINRRRVCGGKSLPYDAEVEYLQNSGTQYILTDIVETMGTGDYWEMTAIVENASVSIIFMGSKSANNTKNYGFFRTNTNWWGFFCNDYSGDVQGVVQRANTGTFYMKLATNSRATYTLKLDGSNVSTRVYRQTDITPDYPLAFFGRNIEGVVTASIGSFKFVSARFVKSDSTVKVDIVPVRKGRVGYLYDKISNKIYGNNGTGSFILGSDKT
jgi:hypothetical protein